MRLILTDCINLTFSLNFMITFEIAYQATDTQKSKFKLNSSSECFSQSSNIYVHYIFFNVINPTYERNKVSCKFLDDTYYQYNSLI